MSIQITIDGPAASGKTYIAKWLATKLQFLYVDTGIYYRAFTWWCIYNKVDTSSLIAIKTALEDFTCTAYGEDYIVNGELVKGVDIYTSAINKLISSIAAQKCVREKLTILQRSWAKQNDSVVVGRDAGTVIVPDALCKIFITASLEVRAQRRYIQDRNNGLDVDFNHIKQIMFERDQKDEQRQWSPLKPADDAIVVDNSHLTIFEFQTKIWAIVKSKIITPKG